MSHPRIRNIAKARVHYGIRPVIAYLCDRKLCGEHCHYPECKHTTDITHAKNRKSGYHTLVPVDKNVYIEEE